MLLVITKTVSSGALIMIHHFLLSYLSYLICAGEYYHVRMCYSNIALYLLGVHSAVIYFSSQ